MKEMKIEKRVLRGTKVDGVINVEAAAHLEYQREQGGLRALGPITITGQYRTGHDAYPFKEILELDVLAPKVKLSQTEPFSIAILKVSGVADDGILLNLMLGIHGILDTQSEVVSSQLDDVIDAIPQNVQEEANADPEVVDESPADEGEEEIECIEDLFEDADNVYTSCCLVVAKLNDSYETIAARYQVDVNDLRTVNKNKPLEPKMLVMLP